MVLHRRIVLMLTCAAALFVSCSDDETNGNGGDDPVVPPAEVTADVDYKISGGKDMLLLFDVQAKYTDAAGQTATANVTSLPWNVAVKGVKVPFDANVELVLTAKEEVAEQATYTVGIGLGIAYTTTDGQYKNASSSGTMTIAKDKVKEYQTTILGRTFKSSEQIKASEK